MKVYHYLLALIGLAVVVASGKAPAVTTPRSATAVVAFWREAGPALWFAKDAGFDQKFRERFAVDYEAAASGAYESWLATPEGALALIILLDQYPRNSFRGTSRMYATDELARSYARRAIQLGHDEAVENALALFVYLPFAHSEFLADQNRSVELTTRLGERHREHAEGHREIIRRFGRFPHRNPILGRAMRPEEQKFLDDGGFAG